MLGLSLLVSAEVNQDTSGENPERWDGVGGGEKTRQAGELPQVWII